MDRGKDLAKPHNAQVNPTTAADSTGAMLSLKKLGTELGSQSTETQEEPFSFLMHFPTAPRLTLI